MRSIPALLTTLLVNLLASQACAEEALRLSGDLESVVAKLTEQGVSSPAVVVVDRASISPGECQDLLSAIDACRKAKRRVVAVCPKLPKPAGGGAAAVAMSCGAIAMVEGASLDGAEDGWCANPAMADQIRSKCAKLGGIDPLLAERLCAATSDLYWSSESGFSSDKSPVQIAKAGAPITIDHALLRSVGIGASVFPTLEEALAAAEAGSVDWRDPAPRGRSADKPKNGQKEPRKPAPPARRDPAELEKKLQPEIKKYNDALAKLHALQKKFEPYWTGAEGVWTSKHKGLREIWRTGSDHTDHADTRTTCQRLQAEMSAQSTTLLTTADNIVRLARDPEHPAVLRVNSQREPLEKFRDAVKRNKCDLYEQWSKPVLDLK